jgi:hypothetical protein
MLKYPRHILSSDFNALSLPQQYIRTFNVSISATAIPVPPPSKKDGLPVWAIVLIAVGGAAGLAGLAFVGYKIYLKKKRNTYNRLSNAEDSGANQMA